MVGKKVDHKVHPGKDHTKWTTSEAKKQAALDACGFEHYMNAEALPDLYQQALGPQEEDATYHAPTVPSNTKAVIKAAEAVMAERAKAEESEEELWDRDGVANLEKRWKREAEEKADAERRKTMRIPSSVSSSHVDTGATVKGTKLIGKSDLVAKGSASTKTKAKPKRPTPSARPKKRPVSEVEEDEATASSAAEGGEGSEPKSTKRAKKTNEPAA